MSFSASVSELVVQSSSPLVGCAPSWQRVELAMVADILNGFPWKSSFFSDHSGVPLIRIRDVTSGSTATRYRGEIVDGFWIDDGDLLIGMDGDFNCRVWAGGRALLNQRVCRITPDESFYLKPFLASVLPGYLQLINSDTHSITVKHLSSKTLAEIPLPLPPLPEQRRIVAKIDSLTAKSGRARDHLDHIPRLVEKYKQAILAAAFRGDLTREWRRLHPRHLAPLPRDPSKIRKKYSDVAGFLAPYDVPSSWRWLCLPELGDLDRGRSRHRPRNDKRLFGGPYPFVQTGEVRQADRFLTSYGETYSDFGLAQSRLWPAGTVCITIAANIAETAILALDACFPDSVVGFLPDNDRSNASYVEFFLRTAREELAAFAPATAQKNINLDTLAAIRLPMAPLVEQAEIVHRIETAFAWIDRLATEATSALKLIDQLDQAVLAKAFRGELVPQDPADEPASVLLERIRAERGAAPKPRRGRRPAAEA